MVSYHPQAEVFHSRLECISQGTVEILLHRWWRGWSPKIFHIWWSGTKCQSWNEVTINILAKQQTEEFKSTVFSTSQDCNFHSSMMINRFLQEWIIRVDTHGSLEGGLVFKWKIRVVDIDLVQLNNGCYWTPNVWGLSLSVDGKVHSLTEEHLSPKGSIQQGPHERGPGAI